jgi:hypothetical protein
MSTFVESPCDLEAQPASRLAPQPLAWLWPGRLAQGKLAMLDADPGMGKSLVTLDLCARLSTGRPFPDGAAVAGPGRCLLLNAEDGAQDTVLPRLRALGADLDRVFLLPHEDSATGMPIRFPSRADLLERNVARTGARLVVIDPIVAFLGPSVLTSQDQSVRQALYPLARIADRHQAAILLVRHLNKLGGTQSLYRGGGSIGFVGACRSAWLLARDPHRPERRVLAQIKNNLAAPQPSLAFSLPEDPALPPALTWHGVCDWTADELLGGVLRTAGLAGPRHRAKELLSRLLEEGPRTTRDLWERAKEQNLSDNTMHRARRDLDLEIHRTCVNGKIVSTWSLPRNAEAAEEWLETPADDFEAWKRRLRDQYPPGTPLDEE